MELRSWGKKVEGRVLSSKSQSQVLQEWWKLLSNPDNSNDFPKLELSGVGVPPSNSRPLSNGKGEKIPNFVSYFLWKQNVQIRGWKWCGLHWDSQGHLLLIQQGEVEVQYCYGKTMGRWRYKIIRGDINAVVRDEGIPP